MGQPAMLEAEPQTATHAAAQGRLMPGSMVKVNDRRAIVLRVILEVESMDPFVGATVRIPLRTPLYEVELVETHRRLAPHPRRYRLPKNQRILRLFPDEFDVLSGRYAPGLPAGGPARYAARVYRSSVAKPLAVRRTNPTSFSGSCS